MHEFLTLKAIAVFSIVSVIISWVIAQFELLGNQADQLLSVTILLTIVVVIWKALVRKETAEVKALYELIDSLRTEIISLNTRIDILKELLEHKQDEIKDLKK